MLLEYDQAWCHDSLLRKPVPALHHPLGEHPFPNIQPKTPLAHLPAIPSGPVIGHQKEEISACPSISPCEEAVDRDEVSPQSPLLQAEKAKWL